MSENCICFEEKYNSCFSCVTARKFMFTFYISEWAYQFCMDIDKNRDPVVDSNYYKNVFHLVLLKHSHMQKRGRDR